MPLFEFSIVVVEPFVFCAKTNPPKQNTNVNTKATNNFFMILYLLLENSEKQFASTPNPVLSQ